MHELTKASLVVKLLKHNILKMEYGIIILYEKCLIIFYYVYIILTWFYNNWGPDI